MSETTRTSDERSLHDEPGDVDRDALGRGARAVFDWVLVVGIAILVAVLVRTFVLAHFVVDGTSMASTLDTGDRVFVNKLSYRLGEPGRGDVIVLHQLNGTTERDLIKRVIALPGEEIEIRSCEVLITDTDGTTRRLLEPYLDPQVVAPGNCGGDTPPTPVPPEHIFVLGDNRSGSQDSRALGPIETDEVVGRAFVVFWPRQNWQWL
ncbi:MAG: signal peptidase I [Ilumatobacteraceae bacterium]